MNTLVNTENYFFFKTIHILSYLLFIVFLSGVGLFACMFHASELPLRHLLAKIYGKTVGPQGFSEPNGKLLASCVNLPIVKIEPTGEIIVDIEPSHPNIDKMYLY